MDILQLFQRMIQLLSTTANLFQKTKHLSTLILLNKSIFNISQISLSMEAPSETSKISLPFNTVPLENQSISFLEVNPENMGIVQLYSFYLLKNSHRSIQVAVVLPFMNIIDPLKIDLYLHQLAWLLNLEKIQKQITFFVTQAESEQEIEQFKKALKDHCKDRTWLDYIIQNNQIYQPKQIGKSKEIDASLVFKNLSMFVEQKVVDEYESQMRRQLLVIFEQVLQNLLKKEKFLIIKSLKEVFNKKLEIKQLSEGILNLITNEIEDIVLEKYVKFQNFFVFYEEIRKKKERINLVLELKIIFAQFINKNSPQLQYQVEELRKIQENEELDRILNKVTLKKTKSEEVEEIRKLIEKNRIKINVGQFEKLYNLLLSFEEFQMCILIALDLRDIDKIEELIYEEMVKVSENLLEILVQNILPFLLQQKSEQNNQKLTKLITKCYNMLISELVFDEQIFKMVEEKFQSSIEGKGESEKKERFFKLNYKDEKELMERITHKQSIRSSLKNSELERYLKNLRESIYEIS